MTGPHVKDTTQAGAELDHLLDLDEAASFFVCSTRTIRKLAKRGVLPCVRMPGRRAMRFRASTLLQVAEKYEVSTISKAPEANLAE
jgi:excisionase family DNA binding protein